MARCRNRKTPAVSALEIGVLVDARIETDFVLQSVAEVRVGGHRGGAVTCVLGPLAVERMGEICAGDSHPR